MATTGERCPDCTYTDISGLSQEPGTEWLVAEPCPEHELLTLNATKTVAYITTATELLADTAGPDDIIRRLAREMTRSVLATRRRQRWQQLRDKHQRPRRAT